MMLHRVLGFCLALAVAAWVCAASTAEEKKKAKGTHAGRVVEVDKHMLIMTDLKGKHEHKHHLAEDVEVTVDGKDASVKDLHKGMFIRVTMKKGEKNVVSRIEAKTKGKGGPGGGKDRPKPPPKED